MDEGLILDLDAGDPEAIVAALQSGGAFLTVGRRRWRRGVWLGKCTGDGWFPLARFTTAEAAHWFRARHMVGRGAAGGERCAEDRSPGSA